MRGLRNKENIGIWKTLNWRLRLISYRLIAVYFLLVIGINESITQGSIFTQYSLEHWDTSDGLPVDLILSMHQSHEGFLWLRTYNGLIRFDGVSFKVFDSSNVPFLSGDNISAILETPDSTLWVSSPYDGLWSYKNGKTQLILEDMSFSSQIIWMSSTQELLITSTHDDFRLVRFNPKTQEVITLSSLERDSLRSELRTERTIPELSHQDGEGYKWWFEGDEILRTKDGVVENLNIKTISGDIFIFDMMIDSEDRVWFASASGVLTWNGKEVVPYPGMESAKSLPVSSFSGQNWILEDQDGGIWVILFSNIAYLPSGETEFQYPSEDHPLSEMLFTSIMEDHEGNIWISSQSGLVKLSKSLFNIYSKQEGLDNKQIESLLPIGEDDYIISTVKGDVYRNKGGQISLYQNMDLLGEETYDIYHFYIDSRGVLWGCSRIGVFRFSENNVEWVGKRQHVRYITEDNEGRLCFGVVAEGIGYLSEDDDVKIMKFDSIDFSSFYVSSIHNTKNGEWVLTSFNSGLKIIDSDKNYIKLENDQGLSKGGIFSTYEEEDGTLWFPSQTGLYRLKDGRVGRLGHDSGIPTVAVFDFILDDNDHVWLPSSLGIIRASKTEIDGFLERQIDQINWRLFDEGDGMRSRSCTGARHSVIMPDGRILVPTLDGVVEIDPNNTSSNDLPPPVVIHQFSWDDEPVDLDNPQIFDPGDHRFVFSFSGLSYKASQKVKFRFRLNGYDEDWIEATGDRRAFYTSLPFGHYKFEVLAANNDGVWNKVGDSVSFTIRRPWWRTWWAYLGYFFIALLTLFGIDHHRRKSLIEKERRRTEQKELQQAKEIEKAYKKLQSTQQQLIQSEKMASLGELTAGIAHEIQNPLNFVNNFSDVSSEMIDEAIEELDKNDVEEAKVVLNDLRGNLIKISHHGERASSIVKGMLDHSRESTGVKELTDINALCDEYIRLSYHGLRAKDKSFNVEFELDLDKTLPKIKVIPQDIGRVLLNVFNNAFYAVSSKASAKENKPKVTVSTEQLENNIQITIMDNGIGMSKETLEKVFQPFFTTKPTGEGTGLGMSISYDIVTKGHGGEIRVKSEDGEGTEMTIYLPMDSANE